MACPFFMPIEKLESGLWPHASRLPLGCGWSGHCAAPGHNGEIPSQEDLREFCNLGYAENCGRLPADRLWDSVRFAARTVNDEGNRNSGGRIRVRYVCERKHYPVDHGILQFDSGQRQWEKLHADPRIQRLADCFLESYLQKQKSWDAGNEVAS